MASGHPVDSLGRVLPDCDWPSDRSAPPAYELIRRFCNTRNVESGADRLGTTEGLDAWLASQDLEPIRATPTQLATVVGFRETLRRHARAHQRRVVDHAAREALLAIVADIPFGLTDTDGGLDILPTTPDPVLALIGRIALMVMGAGRNDHWSRFKACPHCSWVFYDRSKNRSGRWCSMAACGGRANVRAHRERLRQAVSDS